MSTANSSHENTHSISILNRSIRRSADTIVVSGVGNWTGTITLTLSLGTAVTNPPVSTNIWVNTYGGTQSDIGIAVATDASSNVFTVGYFTGTAAFSGTSLTSAGGVDLVISKTSSAGVQQWVKGYGSTGDEIAKAIAVDSGGNVYVAGYIFGTANLGGTNMVSSGGYDMFMAKYSPTGTHVWSRRFGGTATDIINSIAVDSQTNIVVAGTFQGTVNVGNTNWSSYLGATDCFIAKYSAVGAHIWSKTFANDGDEFAMSVAIDSSDNIIIGGYFYALVDFGGGYLVADGGSDYFLAKFNSSGTYQWSKKYGGASGQRAYSLDIDASGNPVIAGDFSISMDAGNGVTNNSTSGSTDVFVAKYSGVDGSFTWVKPIGGLSTQGVTGVDVDSSGNVVVIGYFSNSLIFGTGPTLLSAGGTDGFLVKYSSTGVFQWGERFGGSGADLGKGVSVDPSGYILSTGSFSSAFTFATIPVSSTGLTDSFLWRHAP